MEKKLMKLQIFPLFSFFKYNFITLFCTRSDQEYTFNPELDLGYKLPVLELIPGIYFTLYCIGADTMDILHPVMELIPGIYFNLYWS